MRTVITHSPTSLKAPALMLKPLIQRIQKIEEGREATSKKLELFQKQRFEYLLFLLQALLLP